MRVSFLWVLLSLAPVLMSCGDRPATDPVHAQERSTPSSHDLELNDGRRWAMDDHTRDVLAEMTSRFETLRSAGGDPAEVGTALREDIGKLIRGCTMTGAAHDQLHRFLMVYIPAVDKLASEGGDAHTRAVGRLLDVYPTYFE